jgi:hypothetical protein
VLDERKGIPLDVRKISPAPTPPELEAAIRGSVPELSNQN